MKSYLQSSRRARRVARSGVGRLARRAVSSILYRFVYRRNHAMRIRAGNHFIDRNARTLPIIVILAFGLQDGDAERLVGEVEGAQLSARSFRPLFVIDTAEFTSFRRRGYVVERVMRGDELAAIKPDDDHAEYVKSRVSMIAHRYSASSVVTVVRSDLGKVREDVLAEVVSSSEELRHT